VSWSRCCCGVEKEEGGRKEVERGHKVEVNVDEIVLQ
jgi:hypothetical protein